MIKTLVLSIIFFPMLVWSSQGDLYLMGGLGGLFFQVEGYLVGAVGYQFHPQFDVSLSVANGARTSGGIDLPRTDHSGNIYSLELSHYVYSFNLDGDLVRFFYRPGLSYQDWSVDFKDSTLGRTESWKASSYGIEFSVGGQVQRGNFIADITPRIGYMPVKSHPDSGKTTLKDYVDTRILIFKFGYLF